MNKSKYGVDYLKWKDWNHEQFGRIGSKERNAFKIELSRTKHNFKSGTKVLEIGFGNGEFLAFAREREWEVKGLEINFNLLEIAEKHGFDVSHSSELTDLQESHFDLVVAFDVLEHLDEQSISNIFHEINRILRSGGFLIAKFPNGDSPFGMINQNGDVTHITTIGSGKIKYWAKRFGMNIVFLGGEAEPIFIKSIQIFHSLIAVPIKLLGNLIINSIFFPRFNVAFLSKNLTSILRKK